MNAAVGADRAPVDLGLDGTGGILDQRDGKPVTARPQLEHPVGEAVQVCRQTAAEA